MVMNRRSLINGTLFSGFAALAPDQQSRSSSQGNTDDAVVAKAIDDLNATLRHTAETSSELARIREQQRIFLKANQKFPDFIEIGIGVWESLFDWHVRHQQPLSVARNAEGRYTMSVTFSTLVLRPEMAENYVGIGMDSR
jgi:hypothetical protein